MKIYICFLALIVIASTKTDLFDYKKYIKDLDERSAKEYG